MDIYPIYFLKKQAVFVAEISDLGWWIAAINNGGYSDSRDGDLLRRGYYL